MTVFTSRARPLRLAVSVVTMITVVALTFAPLSAAELEAGDPEPSTGGVIIEAVEAGVWKVVSDGAGHALFGSDTSITFDPEGRAVMCCDAGRAAGEEVEQVFRFGEPGTIAAIGPEIYAPYPRQLHVDAEGALWLADLVFDGERWKKPSAKRLRDADGYFHLPDGTVWAGLSLFDGGPTVARLAHGTWTRFTGETGLPRLAGDWGEIADVEQTPDGSVWVAVRGMQPKKPGGLARFDGETWQVQHPLGKGRKARAEAIAVAPDGSLWVYLVSRPGGAQLARFDGKSWTVLGKADGVPSTTSTDDYAPLFMEFSAEGTLWLTPRVGWECSELDSFDGSTWTTHLDGACVKSLAIAPDGAAWASAVWDDDGPGDSGLYVIPAGDATDYFAGATQVERPASEEDALVADVRIACVSEAPNDDARALCDLIAPLMAEALRVAVDACGSSDSETDGEAMCLGFFAPMLASSMKPPPWREGMDVEVAAAYLEASAPYEPPADEALAIAELPKEKQESAWSAAAGRDAGFAAALEDLELPGSLDILVADAADRWREVAATERALAADPSARSALEDYLSALASAQVAESELRWLVGLPPRASSAMAMMSELTLEMPQGPPVTGKPVGVLVEGRSSHAATRLDDGRILLSGGYNADLPSQDHLASAEVYDPADGRFTDAGRLKSRRADHRALPLSDGTVLVIGGGGLERSSTSAESFDPATGTSKRLKGPRGLYQVDLVSVLEDGRVLVVGSTQRTAVSAWLLDPASGEFTATGSPLEPRDDGTATLLADGTVLLVGGVGDYFTNQAEYAELFDPATGEFASLGRPLRDRAGHTATRLADGRVLIAGGTSGLNGLASAELFDPATRSFLPAGALRQVRYGHAATALDDGRVLITGGSGRAFLEGNRSMEVYDPATGRFEHIGWFTEPRDGESVTLLDDGRVLITGGGRAGGATAEIFDPATGESTALTQPT